MINLRSGLHKKLLGYYFKNQDAEHHLRELSRILSIDVANLSREMSKFTDQGIFIVRASGREKFFRLNRNYRSFNELRVITLKAISKNKKSR